MQVPKIHLNAGHVIKIKSRSYEILGDINQQPVKLGEGGFSVVYQAKLQPERIDVAMKFTSFYADSQEHLDREHNILLLNRTNPFFMKVFDAFNYDYENESYAVMIMQILSPFYGVNEKQQFGLLKWVTQLDSTERQIFFCNFLVDCMLCLQFMQQEKILHRDLKFDNIMIKFNPSSKASKKGNVAYDYVIKFTDFNLAKKEGLNVTNTYNQGNLVHRAPETFMQQPNYQVTDVWAIGIVIRKLYENDHDEYFPYLITNNKQFKYENVAPHIDQYVEKHHESLPNEQKKLLKRICAGWYDAIPDLPMLFKSSIQMLLQIDPNKRRQFVNEFVNHTDLKDLIEFRRAVAAQQWVNE